MSDDRPVRILGLPLVKRRTGLSTTMIYALTRRGDFPRQLQLTIRAVGWYEHGVVAWMEERKRLGKPVPRAAPDPPSAPARKRK
jgi:prophage regulatory protein